MTPPHLHVIGIDPGGTTGWARVTISRASMYGDESGNILSWEAGEIHGPEPSQVDQIASLIRRVQSLDYKIGPAVVVEDFEIMTAVRGAVLLSPVRIAGMLVYAHHLGKCGDARSIVLQNRGIAFSTVTDDRLRRWGMWVRAKEDHMRAALRHAITAIRRAKANPEFRDELWNKP